MIVNGVFKEADLGDFGTDFDDTASTFYLQVSNDGHGISVIQNIPDRITNHGRSSCCFVLICYDMRPFMTTHWANQ